MNFEFEGFGLFILLFAVYVLCIFGLCLLIHEFFEAVDDLKEGCIFYMLIIGVLVIMLGLILYVFCLVVFRWVLVSV
jgi:hypothetical protein